MNNLTRRAGNIHSGLSRNLAERLNPLPYQQFSAAETERIARLERIARRTLYAAAMVERIPARRLP